MGQGILVAVSGAMLIGALAGCADDGYRTDRINHIGPGDFDRSASVDVLGARSVSDSHREGRLIGALVNNDEQPARLVDVRGRSEPTEVRLDAVSIPGDGHVNLAEGPPIRVTGDFSAGDLVELVYAFDTGESVTLNVPVVKYCKYYTEVPLPSDDPTDEDLSGDTYLCTKELLEQTPHAY